MAEAASSQPDTPAAACGAGSRNTAARPAAHAQRASRRASRFRRKKRCCNGFPPFSCWNHCSTFRRNFSEEARHAHFLIADFCSPHFSMAALLLGAQQSDFQCHDVTDTVRRDAFCFSAHNLEVVSRASISPPMPAAPCTAPHPSHPAAPSQAARDRAPARARSARRCRRADCGTYRNRAIP